VKTAPSNRFATGVGLSCTVHVSDYCCRVSWRAPSEMWGRIMGDWRREVLLRHPGIEFLEEKAWHVPAQHMDAVVAWLRKAFGGPIVTIDGTPDPAHEAEYHAGKSLETAYLTLHLQPGAPVLLIEAARRTLARLHHPDAGGDTATMQRINAAADLLLSAAQSG